jgi:phosphatidylglycerol:prolipoprotein diacylglycerol transferase
MYPVLIKIGNFEIPSFGVMLAVGILLAWIYFKRQFGSQVNQETIGALATYSILAGVAGARINYILEHASEIQSLSSFVSMLISRSGLTVYGGILAGTAFGAWYAKKHQLPVWKIMDSGALAICIGYFWGRLGCQLAGDGDYGTPSDLPWAMSYPRGTVPTFQRVHPTPIYDMILIAAIFAVLLAVKKHGPREGALFSLFLILAGTERFLIEFIRMNPPVLLGLTEAQIVSIALVLLGCFLIARRR